jgi:hypothetical protein
MLVRRTTKNQITLPAAALRSVPLADYFDVSVDRGTIVLRPVLIPAADAVRNKLKELGIGEADVTQAVRWARKNKEAQDK